MSLYQPLEALGIPWVVQAALLATALLLVSGVLARRSLVATSGGVVPDEGLSVRNVFEILIEFLRDLAKDTMGDQWRQWFPVIVTLFFFILVSNLMGLIPGLGGATSDINTTLAWALVSFVVFTWAGIQAHGGRFVVHFLGPSFFEVKLFGRKIHVRLFAPLFLLIETITYFARIGTLAIRLLANMFADHTVVVVWISLVPIAVPAIFMGLGLLVAVLQAYVFALLTMIYVGLALDEPH